MTLLVNASAELVGLVKRAKNARYYQVANMGTARNLSNASANPAGQAFCVNIQSARRRATVNEVTAENQASAAVR